MTISLPVAPGAGPGAPIRPQSTSTAGGTARGKRWVQLLIGPVILGVLCWRLGTGPFVAGIGLIDAWSVAAAAAIGLLTTVCSAWRWRLVAGGLGIRFGVLPAIAAYYRSQFLNTALPGGLLGDVHRGVSSGRDAGSVGLGLRAACWERAAGQLVQILLAATVLALLPSPLPRWLAVLAGVLAVGIVVGGGSLAAGMPQGGPSRPGRLLRSAAADLRSGMFARRAWPGIAATSAVVVAGHTATLLIAARTAGATAPLGQLLPLAVLVLLAAAVPTNLGGWGPREGVAAWVFASAGLGADLGLTTAVVFGVITAIATLPGAVVLLLGSRHRQARFARTQAATTESKLADNG